MPEYSKEQRAQAIARLSGNPDFRVFRESTLELALEHFTDRCIEEDNPALSQGAARFLKNLLAEIDGAIEAAESLRAKRKPQANPY